MSHLEHQLENSQVVLLGFEHLHADLIALVFLLMSEVVQRVRGEHVFRQRSVAAVVKAGSKRRPFTLDY